MSSGPIPTRSALDATAASPFVVDAELSLWLETQGITHAGRIGLGALARWIEPGMLPQFRSASARRRLAELASVEGRERWLRDAQPSMRMRELLPGLAWGFLQAEADDAAKARGEVPGRLLPPEDTRAQVPHQLLLYLRASFPNSVAPRTRDSLLGDPLTLDPLLPGFRLRALRFPEHGTDVSGRDFVVPEAKVAWTPSEAVAACSCGGCPCTHALAVIDGALLWLRQAPSPSFLEQAANLVRPAWERTLRALEGAVEASAQGASAELSWRLEVIDGYGVEVSAWLQTRNRKGTLSRGLRLSRRKLLQDHAAQLSAEDARIAAHLADFPAPASGLLLASLVDHPRLHLGDSGEAVRVDRARVGLVAQERGDVVVVVAGVDGTALPPSLQQRLLKARREDSLYLWEGGSRRLTVLEVSAGLRALLEVLHRQGNAFPPESHGALVEQLSKLSTRVPVALPRSVMGEALPPQNLPVVRMTAIPGGQVSVELRVRAFPDGASLVPGEGPRDVHARRAGGAVHAVRNFEREVTLARKLEEELPFHGAEALGEPFSYLFGSAQGGLAVLAACRDLQPSPELEWVGVPLRLHTRRGLAELKVTLERKRDWFGALGGLSVEGERVELARLLDAARRKERFIRVDANAYVEIEEALRVHLERLADHAHASRHGLELGPSAVESLTALRDAGAEVETDEAWRELARRIFAAKELRPRVPTTLKAVLRDYQLEGFRWLTRLASWNAGGILADDMGLGKTVQGLAVLLDRRLLGPALVLAPTSVAFNWREEAVRFAPGLRLQLYAEAEDRALTLDRLGPGDVLVLSYGLLVRDLERLGALRFSTLIFDEAQTLKNAGTQRFKAARALQADFKFALSGTPLENHLGELWSLFAVVFPGLLGSQESFRTRFASPIERNVDPTAAPALARVLEPFLLRRTKLQVESQLPPRTDVHVPVVLSADEWQLYEDARLAALSDLETRSSKLKEQERRVEILAALTRLRLLASHPRLYDRASKLESSKLQRFMELVTELTAEGQRALVFSQFTSHLALVREALDRAGIRYEYLDGQTPAGARGARVRAFQAGTAPLFLISLKAGGFGLNLTAATSVIHLDPWWNPAVEDQASDRAHRIGQTRPVTVYRLVARGTIEEQMLALHGHKRALVAGVLQGKELAGKLSVKELLGLLARTLGAPEASPTPSRLH